MAAEECSATASPTPHIWWDLHSLSSWTSSTTTTTTTGSSWLHHQNPTNSSDQADDSITNANSNHSGLTIDSPGGGSGGGGRQLVDPPHQPNDLMGEHTLDNHLWSQVLSVASNGPDVGDNLNLLEAISGKSSTSAGIFEPACDYLNKIDGYNANWEYPTSSSSLFNNFNKNLNNGYGTSTTNDHQHQHQSSCSSIESAGSKLSNLVSNWSIAPPHPHFSSASSEQFSGMATTLIRNPVFLSCYGNANQHQHHDHHDDDDVKMEGSHQDHDHHHQSLEVEAPANSYFRRALKGNKNNYSNNGYLNSSTSMDGDSFFGTIPHSIPPSSACTNTLSNYSRLSKPSLVDIHASTKPSNFRPLNLSDCNKKQGLHPPNSLPNIQMLRRSSNGRTQGINNANDGKKKKSTEETTSSDTLLKKPKLENSTASSVKAPKVKLGDKITALQQIVSPFGKTDTASVLLEAIGYINFLQQQVQLLSNPYIKLKSHKDPWGSSCLDRKDKQKGNMKVDLRSRGLCLVPISCTPKVYHETADSDYWTPTYRGCLYR